MSVELWQATLNPRGPNYYRLKDIFPSRVPLKSPATIKAHLGDEDASMYLLDFAAMTLGERSRLFGIVAAQCGVSIRAVEEQAETDGFPIREADVILSYDMRAFV